MLTDTGVRLLDFGLAKLHDAGPPGPLSSEATRTALTMDGSILGTLHYMAPEQLDGQPADARSDVFSFGATLYEMVAGRRPFDGPSQASVIGAILKDPPAPLRDTETPIPRRLDRVVRTCLAKDPEDRWQTMRDLKRELGWIDPTGESDEPDPEAAATAAPAPAGRVPGAGWRFALALLATAAVTAGAVWTLKPAAGAPPPPTTVQRFTIDLDAGQSLTGALAVSPDGRHVVYGVAGGGGTQLHARALDAFDATPIPGTEGATGPVAIAPDGRSLAFQRRDGERWTLNQVPLEGGSPYTLLEGDGELYAKAAWLSDGSIVYSVLSGGRGSPGGRAGGRLLARERRGAGGARSGPRPGLSRSRLPALRRSRLAAGDWRRSGGAGHDGGPGAAVLRYLRRHRDRQRHVRERDAGLHPRGRHPGGRGCSARTDLRGRQLVRGAEAVPLAELTQLAGRLPQRMRSAHRVHDDVGVDERHSMAAPRPRDSRITARCCSQPGSIPEPSRASQAAKKRSTSDRDSNRSFGDRRSRRSVAAVRSQALNDIPSVRA